MVAAVLALLLAGCTNPSSSANNTTSSAKTSPPTASSTAPSEPPDEAPDLPIEFPPGLELVGCELSPMAFTLPAENVQAKLPSEFVATGIVGKLATVNLNIYQCANVILAGNNSLSDVGLALTLAMVETREEWANGSESQAYVFEIFATTQSLVDYLQPLGLPSNLATISLAYESGTFSAEVEANSVASYRAVGSYVEKPSPQEIQLSKRMFHSTPPTIPWLQYNETYQIRGFIDTVHLTATSGTLKELAGQSQGELQGLAQRDTSAGIISFGSFNKP